ncbi:MAG: serine hydrolase domain-containing protein [Anaerolineales bacterium]
MNVEPTNPETDVIFEGYAQPGSPGCAVAVMKDGAIAYKQGYGLADLEHDIPISPSTVFNIGSTAKQFTGFAIALLEAEGKLSYGDDLRKHLPEMHDFGSTITLRHLLHHTSGLRGSFPELLALAEWRDADVTTTDDVYRLLLAQRELNYQPGEEYLYVNSNYVLLALICERVSGKSFSTFCQERIFEPLGMTRSVIHDSLFRLIPGRASGYYEDGGSWFHAPLNDTVIGPTNVYSTVEDLAKWDENFYTGKVGGRAVLDRMQQPGRLNDGTELDYAMGLMVGPGHNYRGWEVVEHGGSQGGYSSWMVRFPELHLSVVVLFNHFLWDMQAYAFKVADLFLEAKETPEQLAKPDEPKEEMLEPVVLRVEELKGMVGSYYNDARVAVRKITLDGDRLQFQGYNLVPLSEKLFFFEVEPQTHVEFVLASDGSAEAVKTLTPSGEYGYARVDTTSPVSAELEQYTGRYYSPELDLHWRLEVAGDHLVAKRRKYVDSTLTPLFKDAFSDDWLPIMGYPTTYTVVFERDEQSAVHGLRVSGTRVRKLWFTKLVD